ncbi:MAG: hypothetical protein MZV65_44085 [Chromatiales bacterium]|nr:hypothetical protein [Chromatiales bacterium]
MAGAAARPSRDVDARRAAASRSSYLQSFDPPGVGARDPRECLALQLKALPARPPCARPGARAIVDAAPRRCSPRATSPSCKRLLACTDDAAARVHDLITQRSTRVRARRSRASEARYVVPDVIVRKVRSGWTSRAQRGRDAQAARRTGSTPTSCTRNRGDGETGGSPRQLQEATLADPATCSSASTPSCACRRRSSTGSASFFDHGEVAMRPLVLREIADMLGLHESTISRVTTQKYMATPRGVFELKYFFGSHVATETGGAALGHGDPRADQAAGGRRGRARRPLSDSQDRRSAGPAGHRGRAAHHREVPRSARASRRSICASRSERSRGRSEPMNLQPDHRPSPRSHPGHARLRRAASSTASSATSTT